MVWGIQRPQKKKNNFFFWPWKRGSGRPGASQRQRNPNQRAWGLDWVRLAARGCAQGTITLNCNVFSTRQDPRLSWARQDTGNSGVNKLKQISLPISSPKKGNLLFTHLHRMCYILLQKKNTCCTVTTYTDMRHHRKLELNSRAERQTDSGEPGLKAKTLEEKWSLYEVAGDQVNWTRFFWLQMLWELFFFPQIPFSFLCHFELKNQEKCFWGIITHHLLL